MSPIYPVPLYHERQRLALCGIHAVNNLMQSKRYTKTDVDRVCWELSSSSYINPHRSCFGIGNYDVNVVTVLLQRAGCMVTWHDRRKEIVVETLAVPSQQQQQQAIDGNNQQLIGLLWNIPSTSMFGKLWVGRHWIALLLQTTVNMDGGAQIQWINLDSDLDSPKIIGSHHDCVHLLNGIKDSHVFLIFQ